MIASVTYLVSNGGETSFGFLLYLRFSFVLPPIQVRYPSVIALSRVVGDSCFNLLFYVGLNW